jgi:hypothetical protein
MARKINKCLTSSKDLKLRFIHKNILTPLRPHYIHLIWLSAKYEVGLSFHENQKGISKSGLLLPFTVVGKTPVRSDGSVRISSEEIKEEDKCHTYQDISS